MILYFTMINLISKMTTIFPVQGDTASSLAEMLRGAAVT